MFLLMKMTPAVKYGNDVTGLDSSSHFEHVAMLLA